MTTLHDSLNAAAIDTSVTARPSTCAAPRIAFVPKTTGLLLGDHQGDLRLAAATSTVTRMLELFQLQVDEGPCLNSFTSGTPTLAPDTPCHCGCTPRSPAS